MQQFQSNFPPEEQVKGDGRGETKSAVRLVEIGPEQSGQRIDNFLLTQLKGVPKSHIYKLLRAGEVRVNKGRIKPEYKLKETDIVRIPPVRMAEKEAGPSPALRKIQALDTAILLETERYIVLNKPAGMAVHGGSGLSYGVIEALRALRPTAPFLELVHRLDRDTSGCLLIAKKRSALRAFHEQLREAGGMDKVYHALVHGVWPARKSIISVALHKNELASGERIVKVRDDGKESQTRFHVLQKFNGCTLVEARPLTGRTHQIRVHAQHAGHPLLGDDKYSNDASRLLSQTMGVKRLFLHAAALSFTDPLEGKTVTVKAPYPEDLQQLLDSAEVVPGHGFSV